MRKFFRSSCKYFAVGTKFIPFWVWTTCRWNGLVQLRYNHILSKHEKIFLIIRPLDKFTKFFSANKLKFETLVLLEIKYWWWIYINYKFGLSQWTLLTRMQTFLSFRLVVWVKFEHIWRKDSMRVNDEIITD